MTTKQNTRTARDATTFDIARLLAAGIAGQRSIYCCIDLWSGRELDALMQAAEALLPLYRNDALPDEMIARLGRSMDRS